MILNSEYEDFLLRWADYLGPRTDFAHLAKVMEELGEVADALIRMNGLNPRKFDNPARALDVVDEYADVVMVALAAIAALGFEPGYALARQQLKTEQRMLELKGMDTNAPS